MALNSTTQLPAFVSKTEINAIVETPQGSENKFDFDPETGLFELGSAMPVGVTFPFEFGFIPSTIGEDGDPLDIIILLDAPTFTGCRVKVRLVGVIEAKQEEKEGSFVRNDRIIGVASKSTRHTSVNDLKDLPEELVNEIEHFFAAYNRMKGKKFKAIARHGPKVARKLVNAGIKLAQKKEG